MPDQTEQTRIDSDLNASDPYVESGAVDGGAGEAVAEMGFFDHLEELRWRIIKALGTLVVCGIACAFFYKEIWALLLGPPNALGIDLQNLQPFGQMTLTIQICLLSGLIVAIPFIIWQFWAFIKPGLYQREQKYVGWIAVATIFCFLGGVAFAYFVLIPTSLDFAHDFQVNESVKNEFTIEAYFSFALGFILACGTVFEMPVLSWALSRLGIITPAFLRTYRRHAVIILLIVSAIITPTPDPINQLMMAAPLYLLYEISIFVARAASKQRQNAADDIEVEDA